MVQVDGNPSFAGIGRTINAFHIIFTRLTVHIQGIYAAFFFRSTVTNGLAVRNIIQLFNLLAVVGHMVSTIIASTQHQFTIAQISDSSGTVALVIHCNVCFFTEGLAVVVADIELVASIREIRCWLGIAPRRIIISGICIDNARVILFYHHKGWL